MFYIFQSAGVPYLVPVSACMISVIIDVDKAEQMNVVHFNNLKLITNHIETYNAYNDAWERFTQLSYAWKHKHAAKV